jgi:hypothetical protein
MPQFNSSEADACVSARPVQNCSSEIPKPPRNVTKRLRPNKKHESAETQSLSSELRDSIVNAIVPILIRRYLAEQKQMPSPEEVKR